MSTISARSPVRLGRLLAKEFKLGNFWDAKSFQQLASIFAKNAGGAKSHILVSFLHLWLAPLCRSDNDLFIFGHVIGKNRASTAACAACLAGATAGVYTSIVVRKVECLINSCITLNSAPTLRNNVE
jgi:hypothetical protein